MTNPTSTSKFLVHEHCGIHSFTTDNALFTPKIINFVLFVHTLNITGVLKKTFYLTQKEAKL